MSADTLTRALLGRHAPGDLVAFGAAGERTARDLVTDAARVAAALDDPRPGDHVVLVMKSDRYAFAVAALAAWQRGYAVALPPNTRRDTVGEVLARPEARALLHDTGAGLGVRVPELLAAPPADDAAPPAFAAVTPPEGVVATAFTSGTTGQATAWPKTAGQLVGEALALTELLALAAGARVVPTVGPTHIYGLLWSVLLPLVSGGAFLRETPLLPEAVVARLVPGALLVTVPAHLRAFEALAPGALAAVGRVVTSTAPLPAETAAMLRERHALTPLEVLGSTETGGVAWRAARDADDVAWTPLPGVAVAVDPGGRLLVDSPFVDPALPRPYRTQDLADLDADGRLVHRGRADDVVKIAGRRVSLRAVEATLAAQPGVEDAAVLAIDDPSGRQTRLLALAVAPGVDAGELRAALAATLDASSVPRRVHLVRELPRETNGKLQRARALRALGLGPDGQPRAFSLAWDGAVEAPPAPSESAERRVFRARVPEGYAWYDGHFATYPVMAGAVQLHDVVLPCVRRALPAAGPLASLARVKFLGRIAPGDAIAVTLDWERGQSAVVDFTITAGERACSSGRLTLRAAAAAAGEEATTP
ncbi:MAG: AMP-binding protein [Deltaproteobacteria bacterium]|nr:AMP-binding protein [Deltaproteobacteria bacterium]